MKQFDPISVSTRLKSTLSSTQYWSQILGDSATTSLIDGIGESEAESVRYMENLLSESKWRYAQNLSSFVTQSSYLGYLPQRRISAIGSIYVSHDPQMNNLGSILFTLADLEANLSTYSGADIPIPRGTIFSTSVSPTIQFISTQDMTYQGSQGVQYLEIPVIQGVQTNTSIIILGNPFEEVSIADITMEDGSNSISSNFLNVIYQPYGSSSSITMQDYEDIFLAGPTEYAYDIQVPTDLSATLIRFGDGTTGALLTSGSTITVYYLSSLGTSGNVTKSYSVNTVVSTLSSTLYCSNLTSILGGAGQDTISSIQGKAPTAYITNGGSVISTAAYKKVIESFSYVQTAIVYTAMYTDPTTSLTQNTIMYSAINTEGNVVESSNSTFVADVSSALVDKNSPLDVIQYIDPNFIHIRLNIEGSVDSSVATDLVSLGSTVQSDIYSTYGTVTQNFNSSFDSSAVISYISSKYSLQKVTNQLEAVIDIPASSFAISSSYPGYYTQSFYFDPSFTSLYGFDNNHQYCLKMNIIFTCTACLANSRTLFFVPIANNTISYTCTVTNPITNGNINFCNSTIAITIPSSPTPTPTIVMNIIYYTIVGGTYGGTVYPGVAPYNSGSSPYTITLSPSSGIMQVTPTLTSSAGSSFINVPASSGIIGVNFSTTPSGVFQMLEYPYISEITDNNYMTNYVLSGTTAPYVIPVTNTPAVVGSNVNNLYIPFYFSFDYTSLIPTDLSVVKLGYGSISIPLYLPGSTTQPYLNFQDSAVDDFVVIEIVAQPINNNFTAYTPNSIVQIGQILQNNTVIDDVVIELQSI
jgi:hypothetical protein